MKNLKITASIFLKIYWRTFGKRKTDKIVRDALNEPLPDMKGILIGKL